VGQTSEWLPGDGIQNQGITGGRTQILWGFEGGSAPSPAARVYASYAGFIHGYRTNCSRNFDKSVVRRSSCGIIEVTDIFSDFSF
jgi:hypothetical protein